MLMEDPSETNRENPEDYSGQKVEGFENEGKFPESITLKDGATFEKGFVDDKSGNVFYSRPAGSSREILLVDKQGIILKSVTPSENDSRSRIMQQTKNDTAERLRKMIEGRTALKNEKKDDMGETVQ